MKLIYVNINNMPKEKEALWSETLESSETSEKWNMSRFYPMCVLELPQNMGKKWDIIFLWN